MTSRLLEGLGRRITRTRVRDFGGGTYADQEEVKIRTKPLRPACKNLAAAGDGVRRKFTTTRRTGLSCCSLVGQRRAGWPWGKVSSDVFQRSFCKENAILCSFLLSRVLQKGRKVSTMLGTVENVGMRPDAERATSTTSTAALRRLLGSGKETINICCQWIGWCSTGSSRYGESVRTSLQSCRTSR